LPGKDARKPDRAVPVPAFYRFYLLRADDHFAARRQDYFADDAAGITAAKHVIGDSAGVEIWCERRKVVTLSSEELARLAPPAIRRVVRSGVLISHNKHLLQRAAEVRGFTAALSRPSKGGRFLAGGRPGRRRATRPRTALSVELSGAIECLLWRAWATTLLTAGGS
jgi:hypothetical protein